MTLLISPKKRSLMPSGKLRRSLRGHGHGMSAIVHVGKAGVTPGLVKQLDQALTDHELVKLKVASDSPADRFAVADELAALPGVNIVQIVGGSILLYKRHPVDARYEGENAAKASLVKEQEAQRAQRESAAAASAAAQADLRSSKKSGKRAGRTTGKQAARRSGKHTPPSAKRAAPSDGRLRTQKPRRPDSARRPERPRRPENPRRTEKPRRPESGRRPDNPRRSPARGDSPHRPQRPKTSR